METKTSGYRTLNENSHLQNYEFSTPQLRQRNNNSVPQEHIISSTSLSVVNNTTIQQSHQDSIRSCNCGLEAVLREVKINTENKGRHFWSCSKFGGPNHLRRCNYFRWETPVESQNMSETPHVLLEPNNNNNNDNNVDDDDVSNYVDEEVNILPLPDQLAGNEVVSEVRATPRIRDSLSQTSSSRASSSTTNRTIIGDTYTRRPTTFDNWASVPKYSTPQLLDIVQSHLVQQDKNYEQWYTATQQAKQDVEEAKKQIEDLKKELEILNRENNLYKRENDVLKAEKRLLEREKNELREENQALKRRQ